MAKPPFIYLQTYCTGTGKISQNDDRKWTDCLAVLLPSGLVRQHQQFDLESQGQGILQGGWLAVLFGTKWTDYCRHDQKWPLDHRFQPTTYKPSHVLPQQKSMRDLSVFKPSFLIISTSAGSICSINLIRPVRTLTTLVCDEDLILQLGAPQL